MTQFDTWIFSNEYVNYLKDYLPSLKVLEIISLVSKIRKFSNILNSKDSKFEKARKILVILIEIQLGNYRILFKNLMKHKSRL